jgi:hypothetical protein
VGARKGHKGFVKGTATHTSAGRSSQRAPPNKNTADIRASIKLLSERNVLGFEALIERVAKRDPARAMDLHLKVLEFNIPKLQRTEMTGLDGAALTVELSAKDSKL